MEFDVGVKFGKLKIIKHLSSQKDKYNHLRHTVEVECSCGFQFSIDFQKLKYKNGTRSCKNCSRRSFEAGDIIGNIQVLKYSNNPKRKNIFCKCLLCNDEFETRPTNLLKRKFLNCQECNKTKFKTENIVSKTVFGRIKRNAKVRNIDFNLTIEDVASCLIKQNFKCALSGEEINFASLTAGKNSASFDRIDNKKSYEKDNIQWVHKDVNKMKMDLSEERFFDLCKKIVKNKCLI